VSDVKWPWKRERTSDKDVGVLLAEADAASPTGPFRMVVEDVFTITGRGIVATGHVEAGAVRVGQVVRILRADTEIGATAVTAVEMFRKKVDVATVGDNVGLLLQGEPNVVRGDVIE
jgi:translation elongation factor EF-Tu-like GTPase